MSVKVKFWGVRGSIPAPPTNADIKDIARKVFSNCENAKANEDWSFLRAGIECSLFYHGGNTSCVEVQTDKGRIILDMGTGLRAFGNAVYKEMIKEKGLSIAFLLSHVHWDHIQGLPFFGPLYASKEEGIKNFWDFFGGNGWQRRAEECLSGQMDPPQFPVSWKEISVLTEHLETFDVHNGMTFTPILCSDIEVTSRKLFHPQETYGYRLKHIPSGIVIAYTTDHEPFVLGVDHNLIKLVQGADLWITDCQYTDEMYTGKQGGVPRHGWGHSFPTAVVDAALETNPKKIITFHHEPNYSPQQIVGIAEDISALLRAENKYPLASKVIPAYEGLEIVL